MPVGLHDLVAVECGGNFAIAGPGPLAVEGLQRPHPSGSARRAWKEPLRKPAQPLQRNQAAQGQDLRRQGRPGGESVTQSNRPIQHATTHYIDAEMMARIADQDALNSGGIPEYDGRIWKLHEVENVRIGPPGGACRHRQHRGVDLLAP